MKKTVLALAAFLLFTAGFIFSYDLNDYPYKSQYDSMFAEISDVNTILNSLDDSEPDMVFSALKRAGQLKMVAARGRIQSIVSGANPAANQGKDVRQANFRHVFNMGLLVLGKIGNDDDAAIMAGFLHDTRDVASITCILQALGDLKTSPRALASLSDYTTSVSTKTDSRSVKQLVDSILQHNSRSSINYLFLLQGRVSQNQKANVNSAIKQLNARGQATSSASTNK